MGEHSNWPRLLVLLTLAACVCCSCLPVTDTLYPVLTFRTARPVPPKHVRVQATVGTGTMMTSEPAGPLNAVQITEVVQGGSVQAGLLVGVAPGVDIEGNFLLASGPNTSSPGARLGSRIQLWSDSAEWTISLAPGLVYTDASDVENDDPGPGYTQTLRSSLIAAELRLPVTYQLSPRADVTWAAGASYSHFRSRYDGWDAVMAPYRPLSTSLEHDEVAPLMTLGIRYGMLMLEAGTHYVCDEWQSSVGLAIGRQ